MKIHVLLKQLIKVSYFVLIVQCAHAQNVGVNIAFPLSTLDVSGSLGTNVIHTLPGAQYTLSSTDFTIMASPGSTITLPASNTVAHRMVVIVYNGSGGSAVVIKPPAGDTIISSGISYLHASGISIKTGSLMLQTDGSNWYATINTISSWLLTGNSGTLPGTRTKPGINFIGTTDTVDLSIRTNNVERMRISYQGAIGINAVPNPKYYVSVSDTATSGTGLAGIYGSYLSKNGGGAAVAGIGNGGALPSNFSGSVGIYGAVGSAGGSAGVAGYTGTSTSYHSPKVSGIYGESTLNSNAAIVAINSASPSPGTGSNNGYGLYASTKQAASPAIYGINPFAGTGIQGISTVDSSKAATSYGAGVSGLSNGDGVYGVTTTLNSNFASAGVLGTYLPSGKGGPGSNAGVIGFNQNPNTSSKANVGVLGLSLWPATASQGPYGIGIVGLGYGSQFMYTTDSLLVGDYGVLGSIGGNRPNSAGVAGFIGSAAPTTANFGSADAAIYGNSTTPTNWGGSFVNTSASGNALYAKGLTHLQGLTYHDGQVSNNQSTAPNPVLEMTTNGSTYADNQISSIPLWSGSTNYNMTNNSGIDLTNVGNGFEPSLYRSDGQCQVKLIVFFSTNNNSDVQFQLHAHNNSFDVYPIVSSSSGGFWTYSNVSINTYVATSAWYDFTAYGNYAFQIYLFGWVTNTGDSANIISAYVEVRPKNN